MGDRCSMSAWVRREDYNDFCQIVAGEYVEPSDQTRSWMRYEDEEADYGAFDARMDAGAKGLIFVGQSGAGFDYDAEMFYSDGGGMKSQDVGKNGGYIVPWNNEKNKVKSGAIKKINDFDKAWRVLWGKVCAEKVLFHARRYPGAIVGQDQTDEEE